MTKRTTYLSALLLSLSLGLTACGKKDDSFLKSKSGAKAADPSTTRQAQVQGEADGVSELDLIDVQRIYGDMDPTTWIHATLKVNGNTQELWTNHGSPSTGYAMTANGSTQFGQLTANVVGYCKDIYCRQYYMLVDVTLGSTRKLQFGVKYDFENNNQRWYTLRRPDRWINSVADLVTYMDDVNNFLD